MDTEPPRERDTFARYLAKQYIANKGYKLGTAPEAAALAAASDIVLTRADGLSFQIICIVDREARPEANFALTREAVAQIGQRCLGYAGKVNRTQMPVVIQIFEVGQATVDGLQHQRLRALRHSAGI